ncbi:MAG: biphenyl-2,3-diol 1,2-dioxygenase [Thermodesulfobacteriota bacterium]|jgi:2,3-dihydroxybiphenyl 1,2-dioxygenase
MERVTQLGYLGLSVSDLSAWEHFATQTLGLQVAEKTADGSLLLRMDEYHHRLLVHPTGQDDLAYIGWEVADEHALRAMAAQLQAAGVEVRPGTRAEAEARRVVDLIAFRDPSGIASEVFYGPLMAFDEPFHSPRPLSGFVAGTQGLGHMVLTMDDFDQSLHFYRDVLGMRVSDFVQVERPSGQRLRLVFFHCNPRHHTVAFYAMPNPPKRLNHFMLQTQSLDDVGATFYLCQDQGVPISRGLGRHTNDHMVSFYLRSPSGFEVEYGWGGRVVDDSTWQVQYHTSGSMWGHRPVGR